MNRFRAMLRRWINPRATEDALHDEIHSYLQHDIDAKIRAGLTPHEARRAAHLELGGIEQVKEHNRENRSGAAVDSAFQDFRYALRTLAHAPGFCLSVTTSLALGIAAVVAVFAFLNGWLLRPYSGVVEQDRLVQVAVQEPCTGGGCWIPITSSAKDVAFLRASLTTLDGVAASTLADVAVRTPEPQSLQAAFVSENYFDVLQTRPQIGRFFSTEEGRPEYANVAVISNELWAEEFGADPGVLGKTIVVGNQSLRIIGVAPPFFAGIHSAIGRAGPALWVPLAVADLVPSSRMQGKTILPADQRALRSFGRLRDGVDIAQARAQALAVTLPAASAHRVWVEEVTRGVRSRALVFSLLMPAPILVLFLACLNAANLLLVRASRRNREIAIRLAIGASRWRVVRQLLLESMVLAGISAVVALPLAWAGLEAAGRYLLLPMPIDLNVMAIAVITATLSAVGFGLMPAFLITRTQPARALGSAQSGGEGTPQRTRGRRALVVVQVALSLGLLAAGTQLVSAFHAIDRTAGTPGNRLLIASIDLEQLQYTPAAADVFYDRALKTVAGVPGVQSVGLAHVSSLWTFREGKGPDSVVAWRPEDPPQRFRPMYLGGYVAGNFFETVGLPIVEGRAFTPEDATGNRPRVVIVNRPFADKLQGPAVGQQLWVMSRYAEASAAVLVTIAGVVEPAQNPSYGREGEPTPAVYVPVPLRDELSLALYVRARDSAESLKTPIAAAVRQVDPRIPFVSLASLDEINERERLPQTGLSRAASFLGLVALVLATLGLYAVVSFIMDSRLREIAIRLTLGADRSTVFGMVLRQALSMVLTGTVLGGLVAYAASQILRAQVHAVLGVDKVVFLGALVVLLLPMLLASIIPALRVMRTDPARYLRAE